jgi:tetrapyrrole methylase family protein / MazG family protein
MTGESRKGADEGAEAFAELVRIVHRLRAPDGCPWDREQTPASLKPFIVEEAYEVIDAIDSGGPGDLREELGDLLLQIVLQAEIAGEAGDFDIDAVARGISAKLIHRHPHVFGGERVDGSGQVLRNWEQIKRAEKKNRGLFDGLPSFLPALLKASRMGEKAGRVGFDWRAAGEVRAKVSEELAELDEAVAADDPQAIEHELGDLLFVLAQWARHLGRNPEESLRSGCDRFARRFARMDRDLRGRGARMDRLGIEELELAWQRAKREEEEE